MNCKDCFFLCSLFSDLLFFCIASIVGYTFEGSESSPIYKIYMSAMGGLVIAFLIMDLLRRRIYTCSSFWCLLVALPMFVFASFYWQTGRYVLDVGRMRQNLLYIFCFSYPACCAGIYMAHAGLKRFVKYLDWVMLIMTVSFVYAIAASVMGTANVGGASYQVMAYMSGFVFCINICMILWGNHYERFSLFRGERWNLIAYGLLVIQLLACLISGGRGGFVLLAVGAGYMLYRSKKLGRIVALALFAFLLALAVGSYLDTPLFEKLENSTARTFNYLQGDSEDVMEVSGRSGIISHTIQVIQEDHYMGRGLFRSLQEYYPHNFFLEVVEQGGVLYLLFWIVILWVIVRKVHSLVENDHLYILLPLAMYPAVYLMLSGSYTFNALFWFIISFVWTQSELSSKIQVVR